MLILSSHLYLKLKVRKKRRLNQQLQKHPGLMMVKRRKRRRRELFLMSLSGHHCK